MEQTELNFVGKCCGKCGATPSKLTEVDGKLWCNNCLGDHFFSCYHCRKWNPHKSKWSIRDSAGYGTIIVCEACFKEHFVKCDCCGYGCRKSAARFYENQPHRYYCKHCYDRMFVCVGCQRRLFEDHHYAGGMCRQCWDDERRAINPNHEARAPQEFRGQGPHFYGIELEVVVDEKLERRASYAKKILKLFGDFVITKHDGSIVDRNGRVNGFEIVTVPASKVIHFEKWNYFFDNLPKGLRSYDTQTCGLHIHCSRKPLSQLTIAKMLLFVNSRENVKFIQTIAGRPANQYCKIQEKKYCDARPRVQDRYEALNLVNKGTVEFRIFRGTLKRESLFKSIEFCDALIHFCKDCLFSVSDSRRVDKFVEYVKLNRKDWPHLWAFICARWIGVENDLTKKYGFPLPDKPAEVEEYNNEPNPERRPNGDDAPDYDEEFIDDFDDDDENYN